MDDQKTSWMTAFPLSMLAKPWQGVKRPGLPLSVTTVTLALIELPPYGVQNFHHADRLLHRGAIAGTKDWIVTTPTLILLDNKTVSFVSTGKDSINASSLPFCGRQKGGP